MNTYRVSELDNLVHLSLQDAFQSTEPSPAVWNRIESQIELKEQNSSKHNSAILRALKRGVRIGDMLFMAPWYVNINEQQTDLFGRISVFPETNILALGVV